MFQAVVVLVCALVIIALGVVVLRSTKQPGHPKRLPAVQLTPSVYELRRNLAALSESLQDLSVTLEETARAAGEQERVVAGIVVPSGSPRYLKTVPRVHENRARLGEAIVKANDALKQDFDEGTLATTHPRIRVRPGDLITVVHGSGVRFGTISAGSYSEWTGLGRSAMGTDWDAHLSTPKGRSARIPTFLETMLIARSFRDHWGKAIPIDTIFSAERVDANDARGLAPGYAVKH